MKKTSEKKSILIVAQAFYGNRTITSIGEEEMDRFILGYLSDLLPLSDARIDRTLIPIPGTDNLVLVYNRYQEEERIREKEKLLRDEGIKLKPLAIIPEMDVILYSRCIVCRMDEKGEFEDLQDEDFIKFMQYLTI